MAFFLLLIRYLSAGLKQELQIMHLAPKHLCICFNPSILRLSDWIFSSSSSVGGIVACRTDWFFVQWLEALANYLYPSDYPQEGPDSDQISQVLKRWLIVHIMWCSTLYLFQKTLPRTMMTLSSQIFIILMILLDKPRMRYFGDWTLCLKPLFKWRVKPLNLLKQDCLLMIQFQGFFV